MDDNKEKKLLELMNMKLQEAILNIVYADDMVELAESVQADVSHIAAAAGQALGSILYEVLRGEGHETGTKLPYEDHEQLKYCITVLNQELINRVNVLSGEVIGKLIVHDSPNVEPVTHTANPNKLH